MVMQTASMSFGLAELAEGAGLSDNMSFYAEALSDPGLIGRQNVAFFSDTLSATSC